VSEPSITESYYVSNGRIDPEKYPESIRNHWNIENRCNHVRANSMREDFTVKHKNQQIFATCVSVVLNIMRSKGADNIRGTMEINGFNFEKIYEKICEFIVKISTP
jgi:predicted transposase YbfD/YdcC